MSFDQRQRSLVAAFFKSAGEEATPPPQFTEGEWEELIHAASDEFLLPGMSRRLSEAGSNAPAEVTEFLIAVEGANRDRNERILGEAKSIGELLNAIGIEPLLLKGAAYFVQGIYPDPGCRYLCDLDLLVPAERLAEAAALLEQHGYRPDTTDSMAKFRHHYPELRRGPGGVPVDLHHSLGQGISARLLSGEEILRESHVVEWRGVRVRIPSPEHLAIHLVLHSQIHHSYSERIWPPLRAMQDLVSLNHYFGSRLNWAAVREQFRAEGELSTLILHLLQVKETLGMRSPLAFRPGWIMRARWKRRQALNRWPQLRFIDPVYLFFSTLSRRIRFMRSVASLPGGWNAAFRLLLRGGFYRRLLAEIALR